MRYFSENINGGERRTSVDECSVALLLFKAVYSSERVINLFES